MRRMRRCPVVAAGFWMAVETPFSPNTFRVLLASYARARPWSNNARGATKTISPDDSLGAFLPCACLPFRRTRSITLLKRKALRESQDPLQQRRGVLSAESDTLAAANGDLRPDVTVQSLQWVVMDESRGNSERLA